MWNSFSRTLLKLTSPGVPDFFQGTELFDFNLVDPDNRRPVDFAGRREMLEALQQRIDTSTDGGAALAAELLASRTDGRIKLFLILKLLDYRREHPGFFSAGQYVPLEAAGSRGEHVCAFLRKTADTTVLAVAPRLVAGLVGMSGQPPVGRDVWNGTLLPLPEELAGARFVNLLTGETADANGDAGAAKLPLAAIFPTFPVAVFEQCRPGGRA
jgi:(1->4)-alpha-D-glucan 1-alpha-D-glucosylmutase